MPLQRARLNRSKHGCLVCRQKRIKCSESKPVCAQCVAGSRACTWPSGVRSDQVRNLQPKAEPDVSPRSNNSDKPERSPPTNPPPVANKPKTVAVRSARRHVPAADIFSAAKEQDSSRTIPIADKRQKLVPVAISPRETSKPSNASAEPATEDTPWGFQPAVSRIKSDTLFVPSVMTPQVGSIIDIPGPISLSQYCFSSSNTTSTPMSFVRNTYLSKLTSGPFAISGIDFEGTIVPLIEELDPNSQLVLHDPMRLQNLLSNCIFQEAYVYSLRSSFGTPVHLIRTWISSLFLLTMSLELGLVSLGLQHLAEATACFRQANVRLALSASTSNPQQQLLIFLAESTYRLTNIFSLLRGDRPAIFYEDMPEVGRARLLEKINRSTTSLRIQAFDILHTYIHNDTSRAINVMIDRINAETKATQDMIDELCEGTTITTTTSQPFDSIVFSDIDCAQSTMSILLIRLLLVNILDPNSRNVLISRLFAILGTVLSSTPRRASTLDPFLVLCASTYLDRSHRTWFIDTLRQGVSHGHDLLIPFDLSCRIMSSVWSMESREGFLRRDFEAIRELQSSVRHL